MILVREKFQNSFDILSISLLTLKVPRNQKGFKHVEVVSIIALRKDLNPNPWAMHLRLQVKI